MRVNPSGQVMVLTGVTSPGSGNETAIAQVAADTLGVHVNAVRVVQGDTETCPWGLGNYSSRAVIMGGSATYVAASELKEKILKVAGHMLEVLPADDCRRQSIRRNANRAGRLRLRTWPEAANGFRHHRRRAAGALVPQGVVNR